MIPVNIGVISSSGISVKLSGSLNQLTVKKCGEGAGGGVTAVWV